MRKMITMIGFASLLLVLGLAPVASVDTGSRALAAEADAGSGDSMARLRIILQKLQDAMASMKDFDKLEKAGMPKKQVDRMRHAMQLKINQMMEEAIQDIHSL